uniref:Uncharacterized protein n=1 Tax=Oryza rufipogon TaxID=4529 RepID=A0A0E0P884_ORYRU
MSIFDHRQSSPRTVTASLPFSNNRLATDEFVTLSLGIRDVHEIKNPTGALSFDPWRNWYFVAKYFYRSYMVLEDEDTCEQSFQGDNWHEITDNLTYVISPAARPVCMRRAFYWCADGKFNLDMILQFSLYDEKFRLELFPLGSTMVTLWNWQEIWQLVDEGSITSMVTALRHHCLLRGDWLLGTKMLIAVDNVKRYQCYEWSETMLEVVDMGVELDYER